MFEEAVEYIEKYQLHEAALGIWKNTDRYEVCCTSLPCNVDHILTLVIPVVNLFLHLCTFCRAMTEDPGDLR
jgi:hypothetical protein